MPDLIGILVATGMRIGEATAIRWEDLDLESGTVDVNGTVIRLRGRGTVRQDNTKSESGRRLLQLPTWCVEMLRQRTPTDDLRKGGVQARGP